MLIKRSLKVFQKEGLSGVKQRIDVRLQRVTYRAVCFLRPNIVRSAYGIRLHGNWDDMTFKFYVRGAYGSFFSEFLKEQRESFTFFDIGANQGLYSIIASSNPHCNRVYAFEPVPSIVLLLEENLKLNSCSKVVIINKAISDRVDVLTINHNPRHSGSTSLQEKGRSLRPNHQEIQIETINQPEIDKIIGVTNEKIIVKIDVEGHESIVIDELIRSSSFNSISEIFYECDESWISADYVKKRLGENGFTVFTKVGDGRHYDVLAQRNR